MKIIILRNHCQVMVVSVHQSMFIVPDSTPRGLAKTSSSDYKSPLISLPVMIWSSKYIINHRRCFYFRTPFKNSPTKGRNFINTSLVCIFSLKTRNRSSLDPESAFLIWWNLSITKNFYTHMLSIRVCSTKINQVKIHLSQPYPQVILLSAASNSGSGRSRLVLDRLRSF